MSNDASKPKKTEISFGMNFHPGPLGGALVDKVEKFGAAAKAGIQVGDEILLWNGEKLASFDHMVDIVTKTGVGGTIKLTYSRNGKTADTNLVLQAKKKTLSLDLEEIDEVLERKISP